MNNRQSGDNGKKQRFEAEALVHLNTLHRTALRMTKNEGDADDLVQDTYMKAYRFWDKFEEGSNCRAWLFKIMTNLFINDYRAKGRTPQVVDLEDVDDDFLFGHLSALGPSENPEKLFFDKVFDDDVKAAIDELPDDFKMVIVLSFLEGFSYQEIADIAGLQIGTVKSRLHRGRKLLQKSLWKYALKNGFIKEPA
ncbi:MAG: RNA polymerase subunit sigma-24 [Candidatus Zixiibacteriota bacterium]|nr:MAG: RNA polymerase subunit sigma-24 [candidate division Zixibacteria bacterium]HHI03470.1 sigma-70 family RNA polymerase sigma factor [candidate division Zixibacteria bacterium]